MEQLRRYTLMAVVGLLTLCIASAAKAEIIDLLPDETQVYLKLGDTLAVHGFSNRFSTYEFDVDDNASQSNLNNFVWTPQQLGTYALAVKEQKNNTENFLTGNGVAVIRQIKAVVTDGDPASFVSLPASCCDDLDLTVVPGTVSDYRLAAVDFYVDGQVIGRAGQPPFTVRAPLATKPSGPHTVGFRAVSDTGAHYQRTYQVIVYSNVITVSPTDSVVYCAVDDVLQFAGQMQLPADATDCVLFANSRLVASTKLASSNGSYSFTWSPSDKEIGENRVSIKVNRANGDSLLARRMHVFVSSAPLIAFRDLPDSSIEDLTVSIDVAPDSDFHPSLVTYLVNGHPVSSAKKQPFEAIIPLAPYPSGSIAVTALAKNEDDSHYQRTKIVAIPDRVSFAYMPSILKVGLDGAPIELACSIARGVDAARVTYLIDGHEVATATASPFTARANLNALSTGQHQASIRVADARGHVFESAQLGVRIENGLLEEAVNIAAAAAKRANIALERAQVAAELLQARQTSTPQTFLEKVDSLLDRVETQSFEASPAMMMERQARMATQKADSAERLSASAKDAANAARLAAQEAESAALEAEKQAKINDAALTSASTARECADHATLISSSVDIEAARLAAEAVEARAKADDAVKALQKGSDTDTKAAADVARERALPPKIPAGDLAAKCAKAIQSYLDRTQQGAAPKDRLMLETIDEIKHVNSLTYPYSVNVVFTTISAAGTSLQHIRVAMQVNPDTGEVSDYIRRW